MDNRANCETDVRTFISGDLNRTWNCHSHSRCVYSFFFSLGFAHRTISHQSHFVVWCHCIEHIGQFSSFSVYFRLIFSAFCDFHFSCIECANRWIEFDEAFQLPFICEFISESSNINWKCSIITFSWQNFAYARIK